MENILTPRQRKAVQYIATTSNVLLHRNMIGISPEKLKNFLGLKNTKDLDDFVGICNVYLQEEVVPAKIIYDDVLGSYVYIQTADPAGVLGRIKSKSILLLMLIYYNQQVLNKEYTLMSELQDIVDSAVAEKNNSKIRTSLDPLLLYCLIKEIDTGYKVTKTGEAFLTPLLLNRVSNVIMQKNYSLEAVLEFFRRSIAPREEPEFIGTTQLELF